MPKTLDIAEDVLDNVDIQKKEIMLIRLGVHERGVGWRSNLNF